MPLTSKTRGLLSDIAFSEPFTASTEAKRRVLLFTSCFSILITVYGIKVTKTPWLDIEVASGAPNILHGAMSVALAYSFFSYALHALEDFRRWTTSRDIIHLCKYYELLGNTNAKIKSLGHWGLIHLPDKKLESTEKIFYETDAFFYSLKGMLKNIESGKKKLTTIQTLRLVIVDITIPLGVGLFAFSKIGDHLVPFLQMALGNT
ncbi:hypothetical protein [Pseudomonas leptonychotis]|uniref:hypothetical protein n=1 Tax=Pseudomonas leptonychotis TaxID=2448482 RepID=UPI00386CA665